MRLAWLRRRQLTGAQNLGRYLQNLQLHLSVNRLVLCERNAQLFRHPHQFCQRSGPHLLHDSPALDFDGKFRVERITDIGTDVDQKPKSLVARLNP